MQDQLRLDCQILVHPGDHDGHLRGHGQSSLMSDEPWELKVFRDRAVSMAMEMASHDAETIAVANATVMAKRCKENDASQVKFRHERVARLSNLPALSEPNPIQSTPLPTAKLSGVPCLLCFLMCLHIDKKYH